MQAPVAGVDWLELITENHLCGGKPMRVLESVRERYPVALHGVSMSLGSAQGPRAEHLQALRTLVRQVQPLWVSDHVCFTGSPHRGVHDLLPLPYTEEALRTLVRHVRQVQDALGCRIVLENVSSYIRYSHEDMDEAQFLAELAQQADCLLLVDINNIHVSSHNHGMDASQYLARLPAHRVQQMHLAGHAPGASLLVDTHDHPVSEPVWALYRQACARFGHAATLIERDAQIPALGDLLQELQQARWHAAAGQVIGQLELATPELVATPSPSDAAPPLAWQQAHLVSLITNESAPSEQALHDAGLVGDARDAARSSQARLQIYRHAYRARLLEALEDTHGHSRRWMGQARFEAMGMAYVRDCPPEPGLLRTFGAGLAQWVRDQGEGAAAPSWLEADPAWAMADLLSLDWALRAAFDAHDAPSLRAQDLQALPASQWTIWGLRPHPALGLLQLHSNALQIWAWLEASGQAEPCAPRPTWVPSPEPIWLQIWRVGERPHFVSVSAATAQALQGLLAGQSWLEICADLQPALGEQTLSQAGAILAAWLKEGLLSSWPPSGGTISGLT